MRGQQFKPSGSSTINSLARAVKVNAFWRILFFCLSDCWSLTWIRRQRHSVAEAAMNLTLMYFTESSHLVRCPRWVKDGSQE
jgi:hypothetical protein